MTLPSAVIFVNTDISNGVKDALVRQLFVNEIITGDEFNFRVVVDPNYTADVHLNNNRVLVLRSGDDETNKTLADVVIFVKAGLASIQLNMFGTSHKVYPVDKLTIYQLLNNNSQSISDYIRSKVSPPPIPVCGGNMGNTSRREIITSINGSYDIIATDELIVVRVLTAPITIKLPSSPVLGDNYSIKDTAGTIRTHNITVSGNGNTIDGTSTVLLNINYIAATFIFTGLEWSIS